MLLKEELRIRIAGIAFSVKANNCETIKLLKQAYNLYLTDKKPEVKINLFYKTDTPDVTGNKLFSTPFNLYYDIEKEPFEFKVYTKKSYIGTGDLLRFLTSNILIKRGGFLLHSCGLMINGGAYLLTGPSGTGKTTLARLIYNRYSILSDETTAVTKESRGYSAWATPFFGDFGRTTSNKKGRLKGILFLKQSNCFSHKELNTVSATARLLENIFLFKNKLMYNIDNILDIATDVTNRIPSYELGFLPDKSIWQYIEKRIFPGE